VWNSEFFCCFEIAMSIITCLIFSLHFQKSIWTIKRSVFLWFWDGQIQFYQHSWVVLLVSLLNNWKTVTFIFIFIFHCNSLQVWYFVTAFNNWFVIQNKLFLTIKIWGSNFHQHSCINSEEVCQTNKIQWLCNYFPEFHCCITCLVFLCFWCFTLNFYLWNIIPSTSFDNAFWIVKQLKNNYYHVTVTHK